MSTTAQLRASADLLGDRPDHDTPVAERAGWSVRKAELLAAIEAEDAKR